jgi:hypothetical protein
MVELHDFQINIRPPANEVLGVAKDLADFLARGVIETPRGDEVIVV